MRLPDKAVRLPATLHKGSRPRLVLVVGVSSQAHNSSSRVPASRAQQDSLAFPGSRPVSRECSKVSRTSTRASREALPDSKGNNLRILASNLNREASPVSKDSKQASVSSNVLRVASKADIQDSKGSKTAFQANSRDSMVSSR